MFLVRGKALIKNDWMRVNILISDSGRVVKIFRSEKTNRYFLSRVDHILLARDELIIPGLIDIHVHMREPGLEWKETFSSGTKAALSSGIVLIGDMPNNRPPIINADLFKKKLKIANSSAYVDFFLYLMLTDPREIRRVSCEGRTFVKVYLYDKNQFSMLMKNFDKLPKEAIYVFHAEHPQYVDVSDAKDVEDLNRKRPPRAEIEGIKLAINFAERGYVVHITHITTDVSVNLIESARSRGLKISYDVTPHHLIFDLQGVDLRNPYAKVLPPIRSRAIRSRLVKLFMKDYIPIIATDHAPHAPKEKREFAEALPGISSIQHFLAILYSLSKKFHIDFRGVIRRVTEAPARIFGLPYRGKIKVGEWANLVLFNHKRKFMVDPEYSLSKAKYSLYDGMVLQGKVESVILRGNLVYHRGIFLRRIGRYIFNL